MTFDEILERLKTHDVYPFQREALQEAIKIQTEITPALLDIISFSANNPGWQEKNYNYMGFTYALYLLAQFRENKAYPLIVKYVSQLSNDDHALNATGDLITEDLSSIFASVCAGDLSLIKQLIENPEINDFVRSAALESLVVLYKHKLLTRTELIAYFTTLINEKLESHEFFILSSLACYCCNIHPEELYDDLMQCFDEDLINPSIIDKGYVTRCYEQDSIEETLAALQTNRRLQIITDVIKTMEWWACFRPQTKSRSKNNLSLNAQEGDVFTPKKVKVGRNDPCPCGSGKKYKKCCLY